MRRLASGILISIALSTFCLAQNPSGGYCAADADVIGITLPCGTCYVAEPSGSNPWENVFWPNQLYSCCGGIMIWAVSAPTSHCQVAELRNPDIQEFMANAHYAFLVPDCAGNYIRVNETSLIALFRESS